LDYINFVVLNYVNIDNMLGRSVAKTGIHA